jgi:glycosyltransferase involved in cell wall biosynthesis
VAVVVPVHNGLEHLAATLDSVLAQTCDDWELVVVDDASSDASLELARSYERGHPGRVKVISLVRNVGVGGARAVGVREAAAGLIVLLDHDDQLLPHALERLIELHADASSQGRRVGVVAANCHILTEEGLEDETWADRFGWRDELDLDAMSRKNYVFARAMFSRAAHDDVGGFAPECGTADDYDLWMRMLEAGWEVVTTREPLSIYRLHGGNQSLGRVRATDAGIVAGERALERGALTRRQRQSVKRQVRHLRALNQRARAQEALAVGRRLHALGLAVKAAPFGAVALLQAPDRWGEWAAGLFARRARTAGGLHRDPR